MRVNHKYEVKPPYEIKLSLQDSLTFALTLSVEGREKE